MNQTPPATPASQGIEAIPSGRVNFTLENGQTFGLAVLAFLEELDGLWRQHKDSHANYCRAVAGRIGELNPGIVLTVDEADSLIAKVNELAIKKKQQQAESLRTLQMSQLSMGSSPDT